MKINKDKCVGCGTCVILCPVQAIQIGEDNKAEINRQKCVECYVCHRDADCPVNAIKSERLKWPRVIRNPFSSVVSTHKLTGVPGRGTEEMKTNDVSNRYREGEIGVSIELGRPGLGTRLSNIELFTTELVHLDAEFEIDSPVTSILDKKTGLIKEELREEQVLSAIIEFKIPKHKLDDIINLIRKVDKKIDTVFTVGMVTRIIDKSNISILDHLKKNNIKLAPNAKINIGLGRAEF